jgi:hypothetical protein
VIASASFGESIVAAELDIRRAARLNQREHGGDLSFAVTCGRA